MPGSAAGDRLRPVRDGVATYHDHNTLNELTHERTGEAHTYYEWNEDGALAANRSWRSWRASPAAAAGSPARGA